MNPKDPSIVLDEIAGEKVTQNLNLTPGVMARIQKEKQKNMKNKLVLRVTGAAIVLVLVIVLLGVPGVASALQRLFGYLPEVGVVEMDAPLRVLANPVSSVSGSYSISVEQAVLDTNRTVLDYKISGVFPVWDDPADRPALCQQSPFLKLPDGTRMDPSRQEGGSTPDGYQWKDVYPPMPSGENKALLVLPCLDMLPVGAGPLNWEVPLEFTAAPSDITVYPVTVVPTTQSAAQVTQPEVQPAVGGMLFTLEGWSNLDAGIYLQTRLAWVNDGSFMSVQVFPDSIKMHDSSGLPIPFQVVDPFMPIGQASDLSVGINLQTEAIANPGSVTIVLDYVGLTQASDTTVNIDVGANPQPGQTWQLDEELNVGGYSIKLTGAEFIQNAPGDPTMLLLTLAADPEVLSVTAMDLDHPILGTSGSPNSQFTPFRAGWTYQGGFPQGVIQVHFTTITIRHTGPWTIEWTPD